MVAISKNEILFDDHSILKQLLGQRELTLSTPNTDCDCTGYSSTSNDEDVDTDQITQSFNQTD